LIHDPLPQGIAAPIQLEQVVEMRILLVSPRITFYGGAEIVLVRLGNDLVSRGHQVTLLCSSIDEKVKADMKGVECIDLKLKHAQHYYYEILSLRRSLRALATRFDVINVHNFPAEIAAFSSDVPLVWLCNEPPRIRLRPQHYAPLNPKKWAKQLLIRWSESGVGRNYSQVVVADKFNQERCRQLYAVNPVIIPYGIDAGFFAAGAVGNRPDNGFQIVHVGILQPLKRQLDSITALAEFRQLVPAATLVLAGSEEPWYGDKVRQQIADCGLQDSVRITGHIDRAELRKLYHSSHVLVHPVDSQGGWLSPFEAIAAGLPVITSSRLTAASILQEHSLAMVNDKLSSALNELYLNYNDYIHLGATRSQWVCEHMSWTNFTTRMLSVLESAVESA